MGLPLLSIIVPSYNRNELLDRMLMSVSKCRYPNMEIIIVDDCSIPSCKEIVEKHRGSINITYLRNETNQYAEKSRKRGFQSAIGDFVIFCDDDDFYTDFDFFNRAIYRLINDNNLSYVSGNARIYIEKEDTIKSNRLNVCGELDGIKYLQNFQTKYNKPLSTFTTVFRKSSLKGEGLFFNDSSIYMYALLRGNAYIEDNLVGDYCIHSANISYSVSRDFIIASLDSKEYIRRKVSELKLFDENKWWEGQLELTSKYYFGNRNINSREILTFYHLVSDRYEMRSFRFFLFCIFNMAKKGLRR